MGWSSLSGVRSRDGIAGCWSGGMVCRRYYTGVARKDFFYVGRNWKKLGKKGSEESGVEGKSRAYPETAKQQELSLSNNSGEFIRQ